MSECPAGPQSTRRRVCHLQEKRERERMLLLITAERALIVCKNERMENERESVLNIDKFV